MKEDYTPYEQVTGPANPNAFRLLKHLVIIGLIVFGIKFSGCTVKKLEIPNNQVWCIGDKTYTQVDNYYFGRKHKIREIALGSYYIDNTIQTIVSVKRKLYTYNVKYSARVYMSNIRDSVCKVSSDALNEKMSQTVHEFARKQLTLYANFYKRPREEFTISIGDRALADIEVSMHFPEAVLVDKDIKELKKRRRRQ